MTGRFCWSSALTEEAGRAHVPGAGEPLVASAIVLLPSSQRQHINEAAVLFVQNAPAMLDHSEKLSALGYTVIAGQQSNAPLTPLLLWLGLQAQQKRSSDDLIMIPVHSVTKVRFPVKVELI
ncbi:hypothetical protein Q5P01_012535 [Channa striata]|uniref:Uncharacterized protein n=1 Tax=Channa striata TaxID=64152 RepID=A0AA88ST37_CHASR|nr:hypothetical protein Q5P01_012535 [Channa striata]